MPLAWARHLLWVGLAFFAIGEVWFRLPWTTKILIYQFDEQRVYRLAPRQARGLGLGNYSVVSPPIGINSDGFRNAEIDWRTPTLLAVGSSEVLGPGMEDDEVWTAVLAGHLSATARRPVTVVNAGVPGYGPYHQAVTVREYLERYPPPRLLVVRVAVADRAFPRPDRRTLDDMRRHFALSRTVRRWSEFLPFLVNRVEAQAVAIRQIFLPAGVQSAGASEAPILADEMWRTERQSWSEMADLAAARGTSVLFFVDGADGAPSAARLRDLLAEQFRGRDDVAVVLFGGRETGLDLGDDEARRRQYREQFVLDYDPHANARQHRLIAEFLRPLVWPPVDGDPWSPGPIAQRHHTPRGTRRR